MKIETLFNGGDYVVVDNSKDIKAVVLAVLVRGSPGHVSYDLSWFHNGSSCSAWIEEWRMEKWLE
jgi:hypothetical protein